LGIAVNAATLHVSNADGGLGSAKVDDNSRLVGLVGDYLDLDPGQHTLRIGAPHDYSLIVELAVGQDDSVNVTAASMEPANCKPQFQTSWGAPVITSSETKKAAKKAARRSARESDTSAAPAQAERAPLTLVVYTPTFGAATGKTRCTQPMMLPCTQQFAQVTVESSPPGAEVWVGKELMSELTSTTLSVPFCSHDATMEFLVRLPGRVTCSREVTLKAGVAVSFNCNLRKPR
jgi:hypothetical protein